MEDRFFQSVTARSGQVLHGLSHVSGSLFPQMRARREIYSAFIVGQIADQSGETLAFYAFGRHGESSWDSVM